MAGFDRYQSKIYYLGMTESINDFSELVEYLDEKFEAVASKVYVDEKIAPLPTKSYLDEKFANLEGDLIVKLRKEDQKVNRLLDLLKQKKVLTDNEINDLARLEVFPRHT